MLSGSSRLTVWPRRAQSDRMTTEQEIAELKSKVAELEAWRTRVEETLKTIPSGSWVAALESQVRALEARHGS